MSTITPNMGLVLSTVGVDSGLSWENNLNTDLSVLDSHNHSPGNGSLITPAGLNISSNLSFAGNQANNLQATQFTAQAALATLNALYVKGVDLYYNDGSGNVIRVTSGGTVNATSSGISSGTASASFVSSALVVNSAPNTPANIQGASILLGNNALNSKYLTLSPPNSMAANYSLTLPTIPAATSIMSMDTFGNMSASYTVDSSTIAIQANVIKVPTGGITTTQIASSTITDTNIAAAGISSVSINRAGLSLGATRVAYSTAGSYNWTVPAGVTRVIIEAIGGGGGGGNGGNGAGGSTGGTTYFNSVAMAVGGGGGAAGAGDGASSTPVVNYADYYIGGGGGATSNSGGNGMSTGIYAGGAGGAGVSGLVGGGGGGGASTYAAGGAGGYQSPGNAGSLGSGGGGGAGVNSGGARGGGSGGCGGKYTLNIVSGLTPAAVIPVVVGAGGAGGGGGNAGGNGGAGQLIIYY